MMPYADPLEQREYTKRWQRENREKRNVIVKRYRRKTNNEAARRYDAKKRYGFSSYEAMVEARNRPCEICGQRAKKMCVDHDGPPNVFDGTYRGILCHQCNTRLGWLQTHKGRIEEYIARKK
jgi:hypothetical protein